MNVLLHCAQARFHVFPEKCKHFRVRTTLLFSLNPPIVLIASRLLGVNDALIQSASYCSHGASNWPIILTLESPIVLFGAPIVLLESPVVLLS